MKATAEFNRETCYVITDEEGRQVAVIAAKASNIEIRTHEEDITERLELAVREHEVSTSAKLITEINTGIGYRPLEFACETVTEDGEDESRVYFITASVLY